jgi:hypothetical protein
MMFPYDRYGSRTDQLKWVRKRQAHSALKGEIVPNADHTYRPHAPTFGRSTKAYRSLINCKFHGLAVGSVSVRFGPCLLACFQGGAIGQALLRNQAFKRRQPMVIIMRAIVRLAALGRGPKFIAKRAGPFFPCEIPLLTQLYGKRERLCLPRLREHRPVLLARKARQGDQGVGSGWLKIVVPQFEIDGILQRSLLAP